MASQNYPTLFLRQVILVYTDKLCTAATVHFLQYEQSDLYMPVTTKALLLATTRGQVNLNRVYKDSS